MNTFKDRIKLLRNGQSQQEMADLLGITKNKWSTWELGKYEPDLNTLIQICEKFNVSPAWILGLQDNKGDKVLSVQCTDLKNNTDQKMTNISKTLLKISETTKQLAEGLEELGRTL